MALTTVNRLSNDATNAINNLISRDGCDWLKLEKHEGKIGIYDIDDEIHYTLKDGLYELILTLDYDIENIHYRLTDNELEAFKSLCCLLHVDYRI